jgi:hypothetical protein
LTETRKQRVEALQISDHETMQFCLENIENLKSELEATKLKEAEDIHKMKMRDLEV